MLKLESSLVSVDWLKAHLHDEKLVLLNATLPKVTGSDSPPEIQQIPGTRLFDIKNKFSNTLAPFPNTLPSEEQFNEEAQNLGIDNDSILVVYDDYGFYSCARAWWLFKAFGHQQVAILDGGLIAWKTAGFPLEEKQHHSFEKGNFKGTYNPQAFQFFNDIQSLKDDTNNLIVDARAKDRFEGLLPEPREGLRSGHIPNSVNLPFQQLLSGNQMKSLVDLKAMFEYLNPQNKKMVFSCGSGVTACILALGAELSGYENLSVYDGSWTEYGTLTNN